MIAGVVLLGLAGVGVAADFIVRDVVEERVAEQLAAQFGVASPPLVEISGTVFLPQVVKGSLDRVRFSADDATVGELPMEDVVVDLADVGTSEPYVAQSVSFTGFVPLAAARDLAPEGLELRIEDGAVVVVTEVLGLTLEAVATAVADGRDVIAQVAELRLAGVSVGVEELPESVGEAISAVRIPVDGLPEGMELSEVTVEGEGFAVTAVGEQVALDP